MRSKTPSHCRRLCLSTGRKTHGYAVRARLGQLNAEFATFASKKDMGNLNEDACAIARFRVTTRGAAMGQVDENLKALADNLVALFSANAGHQPHATGVVLVAWMIETLRVRNATTMIRCVHGNLLDGTLFSALL